MKTNITEEFIGWIISKWDTATEKMIELKNEMEKNLTWSTEGKKKRE